MPHQMQAHARLGLEDFTTTQVLGGAYSLSMVAVKVIGTTLGESLQITKFMLKRNQNNVLYFC